MLQSSEMDFLESVDSAPKQTWLKFHRAEKLIRGTVWELASRVEYEEKNLLESSSGRLQMGEAAGQLNSRNLRGLTSRWGSSEGSLFWGLSGVVSSIRSQKVLEGAVQKKLLQVSRKCKWVHGA